MDSSSVGSTEYIQPLNRKPYDFLHEKHGGGKIVFVWKGGRAGKFPCPLNQSDSHIFM